MIHELIHSLTQNEKRYFKLQSSVMFDRTDKRFVKLFETVAKQKIYNEIEVKKACNDKHFPQLKAQLFDKIMESLRNFHSGKSVKSLIANDISNYYLLLNKMMLKPASKAIKRCAMLADKYELFSELIQIKQAEIELLVTEGDIEKLENHIQIIREQIPEWNKKIDNQLLVEGIYLTFVKLNRESEFIRTPKEQLLLKHYINNNQFKEPDKIITIRGKAYYHYVMGLYHFLSGNFANSLNAFESQLEIIESNSHFINELLSDYSKALANTCLIYNKHGDINKFQSQYQKLLLLKPSNPTLLKQIQLRNHLLLLNHYVSNHELELALKTIKKDETVISEIINDPQINSIMVTEFNYILFDKIYVCMLMEKFEKANKLIHDFLNTSNYSTKSDHYILARILHLFIQLELKHYDYVQNETRNLVRFLKEKQRLYEFEKSCIDVIYLITNESKQKAVTDIWKNFEKKLIALSQKEFERNAMFSFNFIRWANLKSKS